MALSPEERARIAEEQRLRQQTDMKTYGGWLMKLGGCFALFMVLLVGSCAVLSSRILH